MKMLADRAMTLAPMDASLIATATDVTAAVVGEGEAIPMGRLNLANPVRLTPARIAALFVATNELWGAVSSEGQNFINGEFRAATARAADDYLFDLLTGPDTLVRETYGDEESLLMSVREALDKVNTRAGDRVYYAMSPLAANWLDAHPSTNTLIRPSTGVFLGRPAVVSDALPGRRIAVVAARALAANVERMEIDASDAGVVEMADESIQNSITGTGAQVVSLFQANAVAIKFQLWLAVQSIRSDALAFVDIVPPVVEP